jgi:hypothetical protein
MSVAGKALRCSAVVVGLVAVLIGLLISGIPRRLGLFTLLPGLLDNHGAYGLVPAFIDGVEWGYTYDDLGRVDLSGQTAMVTGANAGIGLSLATLLAKQGATVVMACRNAAKCKAASDAITGKTLTLTLDTASLASVHLCVASFNALDISALDMLFLNAGTAAHRINKDGSLGLTEDGIEHVWATNFLGHHLLYKLLAGKLAAAPVGRIVLTSSAAHFDSYPYGVATNRHQLNSAPASGLLPCDGGPATAQQPHT